MLHESPAAATQIDQGPSANIDRHLGNLYPEAIAWKKAHGEGVAYVLDKLITNEICNTQQPLEVRQELAACRDQIVFAAKHHDIGLLYLGKDISQEERNRIVNKKGSLTDEEMAIMKRHPMTGVHILETVGITDPIILAIVAKHHTLQDERSYPSPDDLELQEIWARVPEKKRGIVALATKLLVLADVVRTIREPRIYKVESDEVRAKRTWEDKSHEEISDAYGRLFLERLWEDKQISCAIQHCGVSMQLYPINQELPVSA